jgi:hypothetical protein
MPGPFRHGTLGPAKGVNGPGASNGRTFAAPAVAVAASADATSEIHMRSRI